MLVAGGPKNPDFKVDMSKEDMMNKIDELFSTYAREDLKRQIVEEENRKNKLLNENIALDEKEGQAKDLEREAQKLNDINKDKNIKM